MAKVDCELEGSVGQADGGSELSFAGQQVDKGPGNQSSEDTPGDRLGKTSSGCFHRLVILSAQIATQVAVK